MQRIPRYVLYLQQISRYSPVADQESLQCAVEKLETICRDINEQKRLIDNACRRSHLQTYVIPSSPISDRVESLFPPVKALISWSDIEDIYILSYQKLEAIMSEHISVSSIYTLFCRQFSHGGGKKVDLSQDFILKGNQFLSDYFCVFSINVYLFGLLVREGGFALSNAR